MFATFKPDRVASVAEYRPGMRAMDDKGNEYIYVQADGAITQHYLCKYSRSGQADVLSDTDADSWDQGPLGIAVATMADNEYGWLQIYGASTISIAGAIAGGVVYTSATAGRVDDTVSGRVKVQGIRATAHASAGTTDCYIVYPSI